MNLKSDLSPFKAGEPAGFDPSIKPRENNFNFLRLLFATLVIVSHSSELIDGNRNRELLSRLTRGGFSFGEIAVDGFFLVSGFLIVRSWLSLPSLWPYLCKRVLRIYPAFIVAFVLSVLLFGPLGSDSLYWKGVSPAKLVVSMVTLGRPLVWSAFPGLPYPMLNGSLWTIRYEFFCYLGVAFLGLIGLLRRRSAIFGLFVVVTAAHVFQISPYGFRSLDARYWPLHVVRLSSFFLAGSCFALFADVIRYTKAGVIVALALLIPSLYLPTLAEITLPTLGGYLLFASAFVGAPRLRAFGDHADVSYGVYLYAWPIQSLIIHWFRSINPLVLIVVSFAMSYAAGYASWHLVEEPFLRLKPRGPIEPSRPIVEPAATASHS